MEDVDQSLNPEAPDEVRKAHAYVRMQRIATSLFVAMAGLYAVSRAYEGVWPALGFVRALAEAAMVGAIADWFAVTALFRHPLGIPFPHTAIIPNNKDRIGDNLARFIENNFLSPNIVAGKIDHIDFTAQFAQWLAEPQRNQQIAERAVGFLPDLLAAVDEEDVRSFIQENLAARMNDIDTAPVVGKILEALIEDNRHQAVVTEVLRQLALLFDEHKPVIRQRVRENTAWIWQKLSVDEKVSDNLIAVADETLKELSEKPDHEWRRRFDDTVREFIEQLKTSPGYLARLEALKQQFVEHPAVEQYLSTVWGEIKQNIERDAADPDSVIKARLESAIARLAEGLLSDSTVRERLNGWLREAILGVIEAQRHAIARLISDTVRRWDTATVTRKIELEVGRDLQFVRINGTVIGGLVGLMLHSLSVMF